MPLPWIWPTNLSTPAVRPLPSIQQSVSKTQVDQELIVEWHKQTATLSPHQELHFSEGVKATYGPTVVYADELTLYLDEDQRHGEAKGHVRVDDPVGKASANSMTFNWNDKTGSISLVHAQVEELTVDARQIDVKPGRWDVYDFSGTNWTNRKPIYLVSSRHGIIEPGKQITIEKPRLSVLGSPTIALPKYRSSLDRRSASGLALPGIGYRSNLGWSLTWSGSKLMNSNTIVTAGFSDYQHSPPSYGLQVSRSLLGPERSDAPIVPRSEFSERYNSSYFENINVRSVDNDEQTIRATRSTVALGMFRNASPSDRLQNAQYTSPADAAYEKSGAADEFGYFGQLRYQSIRRFHEQEHDRLVFTGVLLRNPFKLGGGFELRPRIDGTLYEGGSSFGWTRGSLGLTYHPRPQLTLATSACVGSQFGSSLYPDDELFARSGYTNRIDLNFGPTRIGYLNRYDSINHRLYDHEFYASQVIGGIEVDMVYRRFPGDYRVQVRLRVDHFMDAISNRQVKRPQKTAK